MGGKRLKFPSRGKFVDEKKFNVADAEKIEKPVSDDEHQKRLEMLKKLGIIK